MRNYPKREIKRNIRDTNHYDFSRIKYKNRYIIRLFSRRVYNFEEIEMGDLLNTCMLLSVD